MLTILAVLTLLGHTYAVDCPSGNYTRFDDMCVNGSVIGYGEYAHFGGEYDCCTYCQLDLPDCHAFTIFLDECVYYSEIHALETGCAQELHRKEAPPPTPPSSPHATHVYPPTCTPNMGRHIDVLTNHGACMCVCHRFWR